MNDFQGKTAFVTGGASGIGLGLGHAFAEAGANVMLADIEEDALARAADEFAHYQGRVQGVMCDVADRESVTAAAAQAIDTFGNVHVVCNNAGIGTGDLIDQVSDEAWQWIIGVNLMGVIHGVSTFVPHMKAHGEPAHVVNTASMLGMTSAARAGPYCTTKFAVVGLSECLAFELAETNVGVSVLCPGWVKTRIYDSRRNSPLQAPSEPPSPAQEERWRQVKALIDSGLEPAVVAAMVLDAIRKDELYVFTDGGFQPMLADRFERILAAVDAVPAQPSEAGGDTPKGMPT